MRHRTLTGLALGLGLVLAGPLARAAEEGRLYTPGPFDRVEIDGSGQVRLVQGDRDEVFVGGDERMQQGVQVDRHGNRLHLSLPGAWKFWDNGKAQVEIRMRTVSRITMSGAADLFVPGPLKTPQLGIDIAGAGLTHFDDLRADALNLTISGSGESQLAGRVETLRLSVSGRGKVTAGPSAPRPAPSACSIASPRRSRAKGLSR